MRAVEFLRKLADALAVIDNDDGVSDAQSEQDVMIPPLQQKIEILKKSQGIDNIYNDSNGSDNTVIVTTAEEDEPFEG
jgi:hypothetical protein